MCGSEVFKLCCTRAAEAGQEPASLLSLVALLLLELICKDLPFAEARSKAGAIFIQEHEGTLTIHCIVQARCTGRRLQLC